MGSLITSGGRVSTAEDVSLRIRVSSSVSIIIWRARVSQVAVTARLFSAMRLTFTVACPLRLLKPVPTGIEVNIFVGNAVLATLGGTGC